MTTYVEVLERFDRKERGWLIRQCTGGRGALSPGFCAALGRAFGLPAPTPDAWWTIDYHLDWLAGASHWKESAPDHVHLGGGVACNIEDIDLVVATPTQLLLIEAKAAGSWSNPQLTSKLERLDQICPNGKLRIQHTGETIGVKFGILSIRQAQRVITKGWPAWALRDGSPNVVRLEDSSPWDKLTVQRVSAAGAPDIQWKIVTTGR